jgi:hypothetical protein
LADMIPQSLCSVGACYGDLKVTFVQVSPVRFVA